MRMLSKLFIVVLLVSLFTPNESIKVKARIVAGKAAKSGQFPWHVILKETPDSKSICGGSLISSDWVLTAAKCLEYSDSVFLLLGTTALYNTDALNMTSPLLYRHSFYNVALIKLPQPVNLTMEIQPIALPPPTFKYQDFPKLAEISGFGVKGDKWILQETLELMYTKIRLMDLLVCNSWRESEFICGKSAELSGSICDGDMGGAVVIKDSTGKSMQIALIDKIPKFCDWPDPLMHLQISPVINWITELTKIKLT